MPFDMTVTQGGSRLCADFKSHAKSGAVADARSDLTGLNVHDGLLACLQLATEDPTSFQALADKAKSKERSDFSIRVVKDGFIPPEEYGGIGKNEATDHDYDTTRLFILTVLDDPAKANRLWPNYRATIPNAKAFYPELIRASSDRRDRIVQAADSHWPLGPGDDRQVALFSLGGFYSYTMAKGGTRPSTGTTCILVARGVLHAAGCNVIGANTPRTWCGVSGLFSELNQNTGYGYRKVLGQAAPTPKKGDVFHVQGPNFLHKTGTLPDGRDKMEPGSVDSTHVGVIMEVTGDMWTTVEGGASDHVTRKHPSSNPPPARPARHLVKATRAWSSADQNKWGFEDDTATNVGQRPVVGWYDVASDPTNWMSGARDDVSLEDPFNRPGEEVRGQLAPGITHPELGRHHPQLPKSSEGSDLRVPCRTRLQSRSGIAEAEPITDCFGLVVGVEGPGGLPSTCPRARRSVSRKPQGSNHATRRSRDHRIVQLVEEADGSAGAMNED
ncbi:MAG: hypothetical protein ACLP7Q_20485 [Isosphaeraceae bacterium]